MFPAAGSGGGALILSAQDVYVAHRIVFATHLRPVPLLAPIVLSDGGQARLGTIPR